MHWQLLFIHLWCRLSRSDTCAVMQRCSLSSAKSKQECDPQGRITEDYMQVLRESLLVLIMEFLKSSLGMLMSLFWQALSSIHASTQKLGYSHGVVSAALTQQDMTARIRKENNPAVNDQYITSTDLSPCSKAPM